jgi:hypothetical protein
MVKLLFEHFPGETEENRENLWADDLWKNVPYVKHASDLFFLIGLFPVVQSM